MSDTGAHVAFYDDDGRVVSSSFIVAGERMIFDNIEVSTRRPFESAGQFRKRAIHEMFRQGHQPSP